jgi:hypothetical protein
MKLGHLSLLRGATPPAEGVGHYPARLDELASLLHGLPWLLAGGLTVPLTLGRFYRRHYDVDIAFPVEEFRAVHRAMRRGGYYLSTYFPLSLFGRLRFALSVPIDPDGWLARHRPRKLKFRDDTGRRCAPHLLSIVEALPYRVVDGSFTSLDGRQRIPLDRPLAGHRFTTASGREITCLDLHYVAVLASQRHHPKHALDLTVIANHLPGHVSAKSE